MEYGQLSRKDTLSLQVINKLAYDGIVKNLWKKNKGGGEEIKKEMSLEKTGKVINWEGTDSKFMEA